MADVPVPRPFTIIRKVGAHSAHRAQKGQVIGQPTAPRKGYAASVQALPDQPRGLRGLGRSDDCVMKGGKKGAGSN